MCWQPGKPVAQYGRLEMSHKMGQNASRHSMDGENKLLSALLKQQFCVSVHHLYTPITYSVAAKVNRDAPIQLLRAQLW